VVSNVKLKECFSWTCTIAHVYLLHDPLLLQPGYELILTNQADLM